MLQLGLLADPMNGFVGLAISRAAAPGCRPRDGRARPDDGATSFAEGQPRAPTSRPDIHQAEPRPLAAAQLFIPACVSTALTDVFTARYRPAQYAAVDFVPS